MSLRARLLGILLTVLSSAGLGLGASRLDASPESVAAIYRYLGVPVIDDARLTSAQPALVAAAIRGLGPIGPHKPQVYVLSIAPGGGQALFGREAAAVQGLFAARLGKRTPSAVLSNAKLDLFGKPLANRENVAAMIAAIGQRFDPKQDMLLLYMTAHGAPQAWVQTDLPNYKQLDPINAAFLALALDKAGINRRILIISACFSGSWIPALASPDTIVLTAATSRRTSFGCDDRREYTWYGAALIGGGLGKGMTWHAAYDELSATIARQESEIGLQASGPMADVGERMTAVWNAPLQPYRPR